MSEEEKKYLNVDDESIEEHLDTSQMIQPRNKKYYKPKRVMDYSDTIKLLKDVRLNFDFYNNDDKDDIIHYLEVLLDQFKLSRKVDK